MKRGNSFVPIGKSSELGLIVQKGWIQRFRDGYQSPISPCLPVTADLVWCFCLHTIFPSQAGAGRPWPHTCSSRLPVDPANHVSLDFSNAFDLLPTLASCISPGLSWSSPFLSSLSMDSPTHSPYGEKLLVFHRVWSLPLSPSHFPWTFLSRHVPSPVT